MYGRARDEGVEPVACIKHAVHCQGCGETWVDEDDECTCTCASPESETWTVAENPARLREICCDTCPLDPTCEEENDFLRDIGLADEWGEEHGDVPAE